MKKYLYLILPTLLFFFAACGDNNTITPPEPEPEPIETQYLAINPVLENIKVAARGEVITQFKGDDQLGLYITAGEITQNYENKPEYQNMPSTFNGARWSHRAVELTGNSPTVYAYYPYSDKINNATAVPVELASQTDYLYGKSGGTLTSQTTANITMKHALALISFKIQKNDYQYEGHVTYVEIDGIQQAGSMDIVTGEIAKSGDFAAIGEERDYYLDDTNICKTSIIVLPTVITGTEDVIFNLTIDGESFSFQVPQGHNWEAGYEYIYTLNLREVHEPENPDNLELDIEYWSWYGKSDNLILGGSSSIDLRISSNYKGFGNTLTKGEAFPFGVFVQNRGSKFKGKVRMALFDGDQLVEHYQSYNIELAASNIDGWLIPCYIDCPAGTYQLKPLFQKEGSNEWIWPRYIGGVEDEDWYYTVQESSRLPSCRLIELKNGGYGPSPTFVSLVKFNTPFTLSYTVSNRGGVKLQGEIKAVWHRTFGEFNVSWGDDGNSWADEIGRTRIDVAGNVKYISGEIECKITTRRTIPSIYGPIVSFYYRADGSDKWEFMRIDSDNTLQALTDTTEDRIYGENGYLCDGLSYLMSKYPSINFCNIILE